MAEELFGGGGGGGGVDVNIGGQTAGATALVSTGTLFLAGGNNITLSQNGQSITISGANNTGATTFQAGMSNLGNTAGTTGTYNNRLVFVGGNNVTVSQSVNAGSGTISIIGAAGGSFTGGVSTGGNTAGTTGTVASGVLFYGGNFVTLSQSSGANAASISIIGVEGSQTLGISNVGNTAGTSGVNVTSGPQPDPGAALVAIYEGFVDVTSHVIERVVNAVKN